MIACKFVPVICVLKFPVNKLVVLSVVFVIVPVTPKPTNTPVTVVPKPTLVRSKGDTNAPEEGVQTSPGRGVNDVQAVLVKSPGTIRVRSNRMFGAPANVIQPMSVNVGPTGWDPVLVKLFVKVLIVPKVPASP